MAQARTNIERFLGKDAARGGPFALLGLAPQDADSTHVVGILEARLAEVNSHAHSETPQADEVRLALHAAAAQLLDPVVKRHMLERWGSAGGPRVAPRPVTMASSEALALERDAILTLGMHGGWNRASLRRIAVLAHARGVPSHRVADAIRAIAHRRTHSSIQPGPTPTRPSASQAPPRAREIEATTSPTNGVHASPPTPALASRKPPQIEPVLEPDEGEQDGNTKLVLGITLGIVIAAISLLGVLSLMWDPQSATEQSSDPDQPIAQSESIPSTEGTVSTSSPSTDPAPEVAPETRLTIPQAMQRARDALAIDPDQGHREVIDIVGRLEVTWARLPSDQRTGIHADLVDLVYRVSARPDHARVLAQRIAGGAQDFVAVQAPQEADILRGAWASGMLVRLARETNFPVSVSAVVDTALSETYAGARPPQDATFERGAKDFLARVPSQLLDWPDDDEQPKRSWEAWLQCAVATSYVPQGEEALLIIGLDQVLREGPEPSRRAWPLAVVEQLVGRLNWDSGAAARPWLVSAFNAPALTSADLFAVTSALSKRRDIEGVDPTMTLDAQASERARAELRDLYASAWGLLDTTQNENVISDLAQAISRATREASTALTREEHLAAATRLALLNEAAAWVWRGEIERALTTLERIDDTIEDAMLAARGAGRGLSEGGTSDWALRYLSVGRNQNARLELLDALGRRSGALDTMDAEVLVREAIRSDRAIRLRAHQLVRQFMSQAAIVNALLEQLPDAPETRLNVSLISDAAGVRTLDRDDPAWRIVARRGLVERLLELVAGESPEASIDRLSGAIANAYAARASTSLLAETDAGLDADAAAFDLRQRWRRRAANVLSTATLSLDQVERKRLGRVSSARGPVQIFAAEQLATAELMAYVVIGERAGVSEEVLGVLRAMENRRQGARHIFEQLAAVEQAMADLWLIRMRD